jgi:CitMHS family citrate-Mg2+:H+ or citrate-Ca2+:H+ symporter
MSAAVLGLAGFAMVAGFMTLIMTKRLSAVVGLVLVPLAFAIAMGFGGETGGYVAKGLQQVAPTAIMLMFAILFFGVMIDAGLFDPLVRRIVDWAGSDPVRVTLGHAALASIVALDGDGTTTLLVCASAMLPIYRRLRMNILVFAVIGGLCTTLMNLSPWGGPSARVAAALRVDPASLFAPLLPVIGLGLAATFLLAWWFGVGERRRLAGAAPDVDAVAERGVDEALSILHRDQAAARPRLFPFNLVLTLAVMVAVVLRLAPLPMLFMGGFAVALLVNYPRLEDQRARVMAHAGNVLNVAVMVLAAGVFTGVLEGTGMIDAMAGGLVAILPPGLGPYLGPITALLSLPGTFFLSNDAFYFGVLPVLAETAGQYGVPPEAIGRAALLGQPVHGLSPLVAAVYLKCAVLGIELADLQRFAWKWAVGVSCLLVFGAVLLGVVPLVGP